MPIFRINDKLIYYAHVPKAGGSSVADYFQSIGAKTAFSYGAHWRQPPRDRWSSTSPQHIDAKSLGELFPANFFDACFTVVRHPEDRIISEYKFRAERSKIHAALSLSDWLHIVTGAYCANPYAFDGHIRPQNEFLIQGCKVFKLEDGLESLAEWISNTLDLSPSFPKFTQHSNKSKAVDLKLYDIDRKLINTFYHDDFELFGYHPRPVGDLPNKSVFRDGKSKLLCKISGIITNTVSWTIPY